MHKINLDVDFANAVRHVHFIGIGGISMSGLAEILLTDGYRVSGSDENESEATQRLATLHVHIFKGNAADNITDGIDLVVYTAAIKPDNPELAAARQKGIRTIDRAHLLGLIMKGYPQSVCVAGTHGKTTTTSVIADICLTAGFDPTVSIGGYMNAIGSNFHVGQSPYFVMEGCEYYDSFLQFFPYVGIILNIESDHMDYFGTMEHLVDSFHQFARNIKPGGALVIYEGIPYLDAVTKDLACEIITYGTERARFQAHNVLYNAQGFPQFDIYDSGRYLTHVNLPLRGAHNVLNALAAAAASVTLGIEPYSLSCGLSGARGAKRRFELKGHWRDATIVDDYAHHPTEIKVTLAAAKEGRYNRIICIFQPHTYSRTLHLMDDFAQAFDDADIVLLLPVYASREAFAHDAQLQQKASSKRLAALLRANGKTVWYAENFQEAADILTEQTLPNDLLITMGAGDVYLLGEQMLHTVLSTLSTATW